MKSSLLDVDLARERDLARAGAWVLGVVDGGQPALDPSGKFSITTLSGRSTASAARRRAVQVLAHGVLEQRDVDDVLFLGDADAGAEVAHRRGRVAAAPDAGDRRHPRVVPAGHVLRSTSASSLRLLITV